MKRHELYRKIWLDCRGIVRPGDRVAIIGGGISGLHLAWFLQEQGLKITVFEPQSIGSLRIPLMHACSALRKRPTLWEAAAVFSRTWYKQQASRTKSIMCHKNASGEYFVIRTRAYLRFLRAAVVDRGVMMERAAKADTSGFDLVAVAAGSQSAVFFPRNFRSIAYNIHGWESYFSSRGAEPLFTAEQAGLNEITTNFMEFWPRAALIHRNDQGQDSARALAREIFPGRRRALFAGVRLASPDRNPVVGFFPPSEINSYDRLKVNFQKENYSAEASRHSSPFFFTAMGYHAMTYTPYLAHAVAHWLTGSGDQNMICTLTPARFLPRN